MTVLYDDGSYSFTLPAIPSVLIPLDTSSCKGIIPTPPATTTTSGQRKIMTKHINFSKEQQ